MATDDRAGLVTRVVSLPVREIAADGGDVVRVLDALRRAWRLSTDLANWAQRELALRDVRRTPDMDRFPAYDRAAMFGTHPRRFARKATNGKPAAEIGDEQTGSLYDLWNRECPFRAAWDGAAVNARDVLTNVERNWKQHKSFGRFAVAWKGDARACFFRYPYPYPVPADAGRTVRLSRNAEGHPLVSLPLPSPLGRVTMRLAGGREFRRPLARFDVLRDAPARLQQCKIVGRFDGSRLVGADLKIVGRFDAKGSPGGLTAGVHTGPDNLLTAVVEGQDRDEPFVIPGDHLLPLITAHDRWAARRRLALKHEMRWPADKRRRILEGGEARSQHMANRLDTERKTAAACLVGYLARQGVGAVEYDDRVRTFLPRFDWTALRAAVCCQCEDNGITFQHVRGVDDAE